MSGEDISDYKTEQDLIDLYPKYATLDENIKKILRKEHNIQNPEGEQTEAQSDAGQVKEKKDEERTKKLKNLADPGQYQSIPKDIDNNADNFISKNIPPEQALYGVFELRDGIKQLIKGDRGCVKLHVYVDYSVREIEKEISDMGSVHKFYSMTNEDQSIMTSFPIAVLGKTNMLQMDKDSVYTHDKNNKSAVVYHYTGNSSWGCYIQKLFLLAIKKGHEVKSGGRVTILLTLPGHSKAYAYNFEELIRQCRLFHVYPIDVCIRIESLDETKDKEKISFNMGPSTSQIYVDNINENATFKPKKDGKVIEYSGEIRNAYKMLSGKILHNICYPFPYVYSINQKIRSFSREDAKRLFVKQCNAYPDFEKKGANEGKIDSKFFIAITPTSV